MNNVADMINPITGKTFREEKLEKSHKLKVGSLVEVDFTRGGLDPTNLGSYHKMRFYVVELGRDCDGTPLYGLGNLQGKLYEFGFSEKELILIEKSKVL